MEKHIVTIPKERERFFGGPGRMLLPTPHMVSEFLASPAMPPLITTVALRAALGAQFGVEAVCPVTLKTSLRVVAHDPQSRAPWWRVVSAKGGLLAGFLNGTGAQAEFLRQAGFALETRGKSLVVVD